MNAGSRREIVLVLGIVCLIAATALISAGLRSRPRPATVAVATPQPAATPTATPRPTSTATPQPSPSPTPQPTATPRATATPQPSPSPTPQPTATPQPSPSPTPAPTATPHPTAAPTPASTSTPRPAPSPQHTPAPRTPAPRTPAPTRAPPGSQTYVGGRANDACLRALTYITTAANEHITRQAVYNAARAGLEENEHCAEPRRSVNEAYLFAMLAPAEFSLGRGDWRRDLEHSDRLLESCVKLPAFAGTEIADDCAKQRSYNDTIRSIIERQAARRGS